MRISDWSSDVCSSDLAGRGRRGCVCRQRYLYRTRGRGARRGHGRQSLRGAFPSRWRGAMATRCEWADREGVGEGKRVSVSVDLGGRRIIKKKNEQQHVLQYTGSVVAEYAELY